ncbi:MAG: transcriptional regulator GcvA [Pseudomonadales bacterium]|nr:transcriptional regulator GcvA [Pseudomonadales bacterium]
MPRQLPPLNALVVFEAAARHLSFTRAAESLHVTQAAVSHQIKALEEWLGVPLFHRIGRGQGLALTESGRAYLPRINASLDGIRSATSAVMDARRTRVVNVATLDSFGLLWLLPRLNRFLRMQPGIDVRIVAADLDADALAKGEVNIDIRYGEGDWPNLQVVRFLTETIFPVCSPSIVSAERPMRVPGDLRKHTLLHDAGVADWGQWLSAVGVSDIDVTRGPGFNHSHLVTAAAINGDGVALGRGALVTDAIEKGQLIKPFDLVLPCKFAYYVVCSHGSRGDPVVEAFCNWLIAEGKLSQAQMDAISAPRGP